MWGGVRREDREVWETETDSTDGCEAGVAKSLIARVAH